MTTHTLITVIIITIIMGGQREGSAFRVSREKNTEATGDSAARAAGFCEARVLGIT